MVSVDDFLTPETRAVIREAVTTTPALESVTSGGNGMPLRVRGYFDGWQVAVAAAYELTPVDLYEVLLGEWDNLAGPGLVHELRHVQGGIYNTECELCTGGN